jgi:hypothetical protein
LKLHEQCSQVDEKSACPETIIASSKLRQSFLNAEPAKIAGLALALEDFRLDLPRVQAPVLVLWGGRDSVAPLRNGRVLSANLPHAQLEVFDASGHTPMDDVPEIFNARVAAFLTRPCWNAQRHLQRELFGRFRPGSEPARGSAVWSSKATTTASASTAVATHWYAMRVRELRITDAAVNIEGSLIGGVDGGLRVDNSRVNITSSQIEARIAITAVESRLDIAGSRIIGEQAALLAPLKSEALFSVSQVRSPHFRGSLHELRIVTPGNPL